MLPVWVFQLGVYYMLFLSILAILSIAVMIVVAIYDKSDKMFKGKHKKVMDK